MKKIEVESIFLLVFILFFCYALLSGLFKFASGFVADPAGGFKVILVMVAPVIIIMSVIVLGKIEIVQKGFFHILGIVFYIPYRIFRCLKYFYLKILLRSIYRNLPSAYQENIFNFGWIYLFALYLIFSIFYHY